MITIEDVLGNLQRPACQPAPAWRARITFKDGSATEQPIQPAGKWPRPLAAHPPVRFITRQTLAVVRGLRRELGLEAERVRIEPPPGTIDERGRAVKGEIVLAIVKH